MSHKGIVFGIILTLTTGVGGVSHGAEKTREPAAQEREFEMASADTFSQVHQELVALIQIHSFPNPNDPGAINLKKVFTDKNGTSYWPDLNKLGSYPNVGNLLTAKQRSKYFKYLPENTHARNVLDQIIDLITQLEDLLAQSKKVVFRYTDSAVYELRKPEKIALDWNMTDVILDSGDPVSFIENAVELARWRKLVRKANRENRKEKSWELVTPAESQEAIRQYLTRDCARRFSYELCEIFGSTRLVSEKETLSAKKDKKTITTVNELSMPSVVEKFMPF